jgi:hypothetical protein
MSHHTFPTSTVVPAPSGLARPASARVIMAGRTRRYSMADDPAYPARHRFVAGRRGGDGR